MSKSNLEGLRSLGFDKSTYAEVTKTWHVQCSQCDAMVINGVPCHERGYPHKTEHRETD